eukprot:12114533-Alexandrium_andersonii.AAC.1
MSASLVGSEMCIRDSCMTFADKRKLYGAARKPVGGPDPDADDDDEDVAVRKREDVWVSNRSPGCQGVGFQ